ncbi:hypothetical protein PCE1_001097 [Barthelona sp. PCE]
MKSPWITFWLALCGVLIMFIWPREYTSVHLYVPTTSTQKAQPAGAQMWEKSIYKSLKFTSPFNSLWTTPSQYVGVTNYNVGPRKTVSDMYSDSTLNTGGYIFGVSLAAGDSFEMDWAGSLSNYNIGVFQSEETYMKYQSSKDFSYADQYSTSSSGYLSYNSTSYTKIIVVVDKFSPSSLPGFPTVNVRYHISDFDLPISDTVFRSTAGLWSEEIDLKEDVHLFVENESTAATKYVYVVGYHVRSVLYMVGMTALCITIVVSFVVGLKQKNKVKAGTDMVVIPSAHQQYNPMHGQVPYNQPLMHPQPYPQQYPQPYHQQSGVVSGV